MKRFLAVFWLAASLPAVGFAQEAKPSDPHGKSPLAGAGQLQAVRPQLEQIFVFALQGSDLKIDHSAWARAAKGADKPNTVVGGVVVGVGGLPQAPPVEMIFQQIQTASGQSGGGMSIGGDSREVSFTGNKLSGRLHTQRDRVRMVLEESDTPQRTLEYSDDGKGSFRIQLSHPDGDMLLLNRRRNGGFAVIALTGGRVFAAQGESFLAFYRQHRKVMDAEVLPILDPLGVRPIPSPTTPRVRKAVLALLARTPEVLAEGKKLFKDLDSESYSVRDQASQRLNDRFEIYQDLIQEKLRDPAISLEVKKRLENVVSRHADSARVSQAVSALNLLDDTGYLVSLLEGAAPEDAARIIARLEKTTGKKLGTDPAAWKEWSTKSAK